MPPPRLQCKSRPEGRTIVDITPASAGWQHIGLRVVRLAAGDVEHLDTGPRELCLVVLSGRVDLRAGRDHWAELGTRDSVFDPVSPDAIHVPSGHHVVITAHQSAEVALCTAPGVPGLPSRIDPREMPRTQRGRDASTRHVCDILSGDDPRAHALLVVEVVTPSGHSSSWPPHKHDQANGPFETALEETYYHHVRPSQGFVFQRVYTEDRSLDEAMAVEHQDAVLVPYGYHAVVAPHGYDDYYLNVMAGPVRRWAIHNDPAHAWILGRKN